MSAFAAVQEKPDSGNKGQQGADDKSVDRHSFKLAKRQSKLISSCLLNVMQFKLMSSLFTGPSSYISLITHHHRDDRNDW